MHDAQGWRTVFFGQNWVRHDHVVLEAFGDAQFSAFVVQRTQGKGEGGKLLVDFAQHLATGLHLQLVGLVDGALVDRASFVHFLGLALARAHDDVDGVPG